MRQRRSGARRRRRHGLVARLASRAREWIRRPPVAVFLLGLSERLAPRSRAAYGRVLLRVAPHGSVVRIVALLAARDRDEALAYANGVASSGDTETRLGTARIVDRLRSPAGVAAALSGGRPPLDASGSRRWLALRTRAAIRLGHLDDAEAAMADALRAEPQDAWFQHQRRSIERRVAMLKADVEPCTVAGRPVAGVRGRVLHVVRLSMREHQSGATLRTNQVLRAQRLAGLDPRLLTLRASVTPRGESGPTVSDPVLTYRLPDEVAAAPLVGPGSRQLMDAAARAVEEAEPAVLHPATPWTAAQVALALGARYGLPVVYESRRFPEDAWLQGTAGRSEDADYYLLLRQRDTQSMLAADAVVTLSEAMKADIAARGIAPERIHVVPNSVDTDRFQPGPRDETLAAELGIAADETVIGYITTFNHYEDLRLLVDAIRILRSRGRRVRGLLVGDGSERPAVERYVRDAGLAGLVLLPGRIEHREIPRYHRVIDLFVTARVPSRITRTHTALKPLEAMASGRPILVSRADALLELVDGGATGRSYEPGNAEDLAHQLDALVGSPDERERLGRAARSWVERERTLERMGQRYRQLYDQLGVA